MLSRWIAGLWTFFFALSLSTVATAAEKTTLITLKNGKPTASLAKSWKKTGEGKYEFVLDTKATIGKNKPLTVDAVKSSLEGKLASSHGVAVTPKGKSEVEVAYTGEETAFLDAVAKARIRATKAVELALESTTTQGSIRARAADRAPVKNEFKATVVSNSDGQLAVRIVEVGPADQPVAIKAGDKVQLKAASTAKVNDVVYVVPDTMTDNVWTVKSITTK